MNDIAPRWLSPEDAARYVGIAESTFRRLVAKGIFPQPNRVMSPRLPRWDRDALDAAIAGPQAPSIPSPDADTAFARFAADELAARPARGPSRRQASR